MAFILTSLKNRGFEELCYEYSLFCDVKDSGLTVMFNSKIFEVTLCP